MSIEDTINQLFTFLLNTEPSFAEFCEANKDKSTEEIEAEYDV